jgi:hypothetical protein
MKTSYRLTFMKLLILAVYNLNVLMLDIYFVFYKFF